MLIHARAIPDLRLIELISMIASEPSGFLMDLGGIENLGSTMRLGLY